MTTVNQLGKVQHCECQPHTPGKHGWYRKEGRDREKGNARQAMAAKGKQEKGGYDSLMCMHVTLITRPHPSFYCLQCKKCHGVT